MVNIVIPYSLDKNLGKAYNKACSQIPDNEWICILDHDVLMLSTDAGAILNEYANRADKDTLLSCYTNRIHPSSPQLLNGIVSSESDIEFHMGIAEEVKKNKYTVTTVHTTISGFLMMFHKSLWEEFKFDESLQCLGVDSNFSTRILQAGKKIHLMNSLYVFHTYRLKTSLTDKSHLL